ncbi:hypothetical protein CSA37_09175 [Candidatus Fermentibacteria bacterium]|nr:MAG: hypothetical protein CSA37_09175 [Candidatus Fermentibacteria bacterium]
MSEAGKDPFAALLGKLRDNKTIPASAVSRASEEKLKPLFQSEVLTKIPRGRGTAIIVSKPEYLQQFINKHFPEGIESTARSDMTRSESTCTFRNSKKRSRRTAMPVFIRGFGESTLLYRNTGHTLNTARQTELFSVTSIMLKEDEPLPEYAGRIATVENLEVFTAFHHLKPQNTIAVYTGGRIHRLLLHWLSSPETSKAGIVHYGDYDPAGLGEYLRIKRAREGNTELFIPPDLNALVRKYGSEILLEKSAHLIPRLSATGDKAVKSVLEILLRNNRALEQEVLVSLKES